MAPVPARPQPMVAGGRVLGEDGRGRAMTGPVFYFRKFRVGSSLISMMAAKKS
ncbi:MAG: hypothetical protein H6P98_2428 [Candidatus Aminicenantes bacterium]|jgi:hypothetical protein|nr:hypothetical protein [Candidatus Aminicenantes bacterium]